MTVEELLVGHPELVGAGDVGDVEADAEDCGLVEAQLAQGVLDDLIAAQGLGVGIAGANVEASAATGGVPPRTTRSARSATRMARQ